MAERLIFNFVADPCAGKSTAVRHLEQYGFQPFWGSKFLEREAAKANIALRNRQDYNMFQRQLRVERGPAVIADAVLGLPASRIAHDGLRNRIDALKLRKARGIRAVIIGLYCPIEVRFDRRDPNDPKYPDNLKDFAAAEAIEYYDIDEFGMHTHWVMDQASHTINTAGPKKQLYDALGELVAIYT